jgi:hypothetical protein
MIGCLMMPTSSVTLHIMYQGFLKEHDFIALSNIYSWLTAWDAILPLSRRTVHMATHMLAAQPTPHGT